MSETEKEEKKVQLVKKQQLKNASPEEERNIVAGINDKLVSNKFGKTEVRHACETILNNKKPQVNKTTRETYAGFCANLKEVARGNGPLLQKIKNFEERYLN